MNWERFGGPSTKDPSGRKLRSAFPQVRLLGLAECGTRALIAAAQGGYRTGEKTLARQLLGRLSAGMLCLAGPDFTCYELWREAAATGADLLWGAGAALGLPVLEVLPDGTYLSRLRPPRKLRKSGAAGITVRVAQYRLKDASGQVTETFALITTLLGPEAAPARELAELYHARWQIETAIGAFKTELKGAGIALRSKTPDGAEREIWALLCVCQAVREVICAAAALARQDPLRISFAHALDVVPGPAGTPGTFPLAGLTGCSGRHCRSSPRSPARRGPAGTIPARQAQPPLPGQGRRPGEAAEAPRTVHPGHAASSHAQPSLA